MAISSRQCQIQTVPRSYILINRLIRKTAASIAAASQTGKVRAVLQANPRRNDRKTYSDSGIISNIPNVDIAKGC
jgi:hypothetical protein